MAHLAVDIGNTNIVFGVYNEAWIKVLRLETNGVTQQSILTFLKSELKKYDWEPSLFTEVTVSSVVPQTTDAVIQALNSLFGQNSFFIKPAHYTKLDLEIINPEEIGTDLVANAVASFNHFQQECIVVDFGTALTFTIVSNNKISGVNILPGIKTSLQALVGNASQLSKIPLELTESVIGTDTTTAIQAGILWGYVGLVEKMLERIELETGTKFKRVATGGLSLVLSPLRKEFDLIDQHLTLEGIRLIRETNA